MSEPEWRNHGLQSKFIFKNLNFLLDIRFRMIYIDFIETGN